MFYLFGSLLLFVWEIGVVRLGFYIDLSILKGSTCYVFLGVKLSFVFGVCGERVGVGIYSIGFCVRFWF